MEQVKHIKINKASRASLDKLRKIGEDKAARLQKIQEQWERGEYKNVKIMQV